MKWLRDNVVAVLTAIAGILGIGWLWSYHRGKVRSLAAEKAAAEARAKVADLEAKKRALIEGDAKYRDEIDRLEKKRAQIVRDAVAAERDISEMSLAEIEAEFRDLY